MIRLLSLLRSPKSRPPRVTVTRQVVPESLDARLRAHAMRVCNRDAESVEQYVRQHGGNGTAPKGVRRCLTFA
jgi:hypothetical protein